MYHAASGGQGTALGEGRSACAWLWAQEGGGSSSAVAALAVKVFCLRLVWFRLVFFLLFFPPRHIFNESGRLLCLLYGERSVSAHGTGSSCGLKCAGAAPHGVQMQSPLLQPLVSQEGLEIIDQEVTHLRSKIRQILHT